MKSDVLLITRNLIKKVPRLHQSAVKLGKPLLAVLTVALCKSEVLVSHNSTIKVIWHCFRVFYEFGIPTDLKVSFICCTLS